MHTSVLSSWVVVEMLVIKALALRTCALITAHFNSLRFKDIPSCSTRRWLLPHNRRERHN